MPEVKNGRFSFRVGKKEKTKEDYWKAIDLLFPKHRMAGHGQKCVSGETAYCTDDAPNGRGNFGCKRCQMIVDLEEKRRVKIWPRSEGTGRT
jgi:hypothetical protein